jgi:hypothetical protein
MNTTHRIAQSLTALGLSLIVTLATLGSIDGLATEQHAAAVMAKAAAAAQALQAKAVTPLASRG